MDREPGSGGGDALSLEQRGMIADTATAALVAADGTIDWYCPRRYDAPAALYRLLDPAGGAVRVGPAGTGRSAGTQSYDPATNVLRTVLPGVDGEIEVADFMPWDGTTDPPAGRIVRVVTARRGIVDVEVEVAPGRAFGPAREVTSWSGGIAFDDVVVRTGLAMEDHRGAVRLQPGERLVVTIDLTDSELHHQPLSEFAAMQLLEDTTAAWRRYAGGVMYDGPYREQVERSLLAIKGLTYYRTGAVAAAATTSLPEQIGGERNWDYRYSWMRDSCLAVHAAKHAGLETETQNLTQWLALVLQSAGVPVPPICDITGDRPDEEHELPLAGWRRSQPVRVGNAASEQLQLDFYADLVGAIHVDELLTDGPMLQRWNDVAAAVDWLADHWNKPDRGIWELRCTPRHLLSSKVNCWNTFDRMVRLARAKNPLDLAAVVWQQTAKEVLTWLESSPLVESAHKVIDVEDSELLDASLVRLAWMGPWPADHPVVTKAVERVMRNLSVGAHVYRYPPTFDDGLPGGEGAFTACSFWTVRALAAMERWDEAHDRMQTLCGIGGPTGLLSEQVDPISGAMLGNLPQTLSHLTLVEAALALANGPR